MSRLAPPRPGGAGPRWRRVPRSPRRRPARSTASSGSSPSATCTAPTTASWRSCVRRASSMRDSTGPAGRTHLVQLGDVVDRGADSRKALDLLRRLEKEARRGGWRRPSAPRQPRSHAHAGRHAVRVARRIRGLRDARDRKRPGRSSCGRRSPKSATACAQETPLGRVEMDLAFGPARRIREVAARALRRGQDQRHPLPARRHQPGPWPTLAATPSTRRCGAS